MHISTKEKIEVIKQILHKQTSVSAASRKLQVSRKTIYQWLVLYRNAKTRNKPICLNKKYVTGKNHPKYYRGNLQTKIIRLISQNPKISVTDMAKKLNKGLPTEASVKAGRHAVYNLLKELKLSSPLDRQNFARLYHAPGRLHLDIKGQVVREIMEENKKISLVAKKWHLSRKTVYQWLKQYQSSQKISENYSRGFDHPRAYSKDLTNLILDSVAREPALSIKKIAKQLNLGTHGVWSVLARFDLNRVNQRLAYAAAQKQTQIVKPVVDMDREKSVLPKFTPQLAPAPPPVGSEQSRTASPPLSIQLLLKFFFKIFTKGFLAYISLPFRQKSPLKALLTALSIPLTLYIVFVGALNYLSIYIEAASLGNGAGYLLASLALMCGGFFFLYSLKYYLSVAMVLLYSRKSLVKESGEILQKSGQKANGLMPDMENVILDRHPFVSIHIATYNEKRVINRLIEAATSMDYKNFEVIICDDSTDETKDLVMDWKNHPRVKILHRDTREGYKGGALREAVKHMDPRTEFVLVFDADFLPYPDTITQFLKYFQASAGTLDFGKVSQASQVSRVSQVSQVSRASDTSDTHHTPDTHNVSNIAAVQGYQWHVLNKSENWITRGVRTEYAGSYVIERSGTEVYSGLKQISGSVYMIRADVLKSYGWGTSITEDFELTLKLYRDGWKVVYTPYVQAPSECVSTLKRLVRQRMRWAEGHSQNIKKMFIEMMWGRWVSVIANPDHNRMKQSSSSDEQIAASSSDWTRNDNMRRIFFPSRLTLAEKLEFVYLSPYYLQSALFILGTFCWFASEVIFRVRLPFWTAVWGWSLVLTNMLSLPLMNTVGLFLEEAEEKDYSGIPAFVFLSYIVAPFQAYAAVKGFIEDKEGPWFRTPKTGKITDIYKKGRFYRWITGIFGRPAVNTQTKSILNHPYLALATSNNRFDNFKITLPRKRSGVHKAFSRTALSVFLIITLLVSNLVPFIPVSQNIKKAYSSDKELKITSLKPDYRSNEKPEFALKLDKSLYETNQNESKTKNLSWLKWGPQRAEASESQVTAQVLRNGSEVPDIKATVIKDSQEQYQIKIDPSRFMSPGEYTLETSVQKAGKTYLAYQDFSWGVLAINTKKSVYRIGETVEFGFGAVDNKGKTICDVKLILTVENPVNNQKIILSTANQDIKPSGKCTATSVTNEADYQAKFMAQDAGIYKLHLEAETKDGKKEIEDTVEVKKEAELFTVERSSYPTRIFPPATYPVSLTITANTDFQGEIIDELPSSFQITDVSDNGTVKHQSITLPYSKTDNQLVTWKVNWKKGEQHELKYTVRFPPESPEFYLIGPLRLVDTRSGQALSLRGGAGGDDAAIPSRDSCLPASRASSPSTSLGIPRNDSLLIFQEARPWQIASDAAVQIRQEINIIDKVYNTAVDSSERVQIDPSKYNGSLTYNFEIVTLVSSGTGTVTLHDSSDNVHATISVTETVNTLKSVAASTTPTLDDYHINLSGGTGLTVKAARVIILQNADSITASETQIEVGNNETGKTSTSTLALTNPKYWTYTSANWDGIQIAYAEVTWKKNDSLTTQTITSDNATWSPPAGVTSVAIEAWGGGGGGGGSSSSTKASGGGGGGAYAKKANVAVSSSSTYAIDIGAGGTVSAGANGGNGANTTFATTTVVAEGGKGGGGGATNTAGVKGLAANSTGDVGSVFDGGAGGTGYNGAGSGAGGGSSAGTGSNGNNGTDGDAVDATNAGGVAPTGGYNGGVGGAFHNNGVTPTDAYGGGGGGSGHNSGGAETGGAGKPGLMKISYIDVSPTVTVVLQVDDGAWSDWSTAATIVNASTTSGTITRTRSSSFTPLDGKHYRIASSISNGTGHSYDIYNAKIIMDQIGGTEQNTYYFDGSDAAASDPHNVWTDDNLAFDSDATPSTWAYSESVGNTTVNYLMAEGTSATTGGTITNVEARIHGSANGNEIGWGEYVTLAVPAGGWDWTKVAALEVKIYFNIWTPNTSLRASIYTNGLGELLNECKTSEKAEFAVSGEAYKVEVRVASADSTTAFTKLEPQYLLLNTADSGTGLQGYLTKWTSSDWAGVTNTYHASHDASNAADATKLTDVGATPDVDLTNGTNTGANQQINSNNLSGWTSGSDLDVNVTNSTGVVAASRILVYVSVDVIPENPYILLMLMPCLWFMIFHLKKRYIPDEAKPCLLASIRRSGPTRQVRY